MSVARTVLGMDELPSDETSEEDVLKFKLKEKMKSADRKALEDALRILDNDPADHEG